MLIKRRVNKQDLTILNDLLLEEFGVYSNLDVIDEQNRYKTKFKTRANFRGEIKLNHNTMVIIDFQDEDYGEVTFDISLFSLNLIALVIFFMIGGLMFIIHSNPVVLIIGLFGALWFYFVAKRQVCSWLNRIVDEFIKNKHS